MAGNLAVYEGMFILDSNRLARDRDGLPSDLSSIIEGAGGQVEVSRLWEERRLAYPINGQRKGSYWIMYFRGPTSSIGELNRQFELKDGVMRHLFIRLPDSLVEPILEHAKGNSVEAPAPEETNGSPKESASAETVTEAVEASAT